MPKDREIIGKIREINQIIKELIIVLLLISICLIICLIESCWYLTKRGGFYGKRKKN